MGISLLLLSVALVGLLVSASWGRRRSKRLVAILVSGPLSRRPLNKIERWSLPTTILHVEGILKDCLENRLPDNMANYCLGSMVNNTVQHTSKCETSSG